MDPEKRMEHPRWLSAYQDFVGEADPTRLSKLLEPLEAALVERSQELNGDANDRDEHLALKMAIEKVLEIKLTKLGFPGWTDRYSPNRPEMPG